MLCLYTYVHTIDERHQFVPRLQNHHIWLMVDSLASRHASLTASKR